MTVFMNFYPGETQKVKDYTHFSTIFRFVLPKCGVFPDFPVNVATL